MSHANDCLRCGNRSTPEALAKLGMCLDCYASIQPCDDCEAVYERGKMVGHTRPLWSCIPCVLNGEHGPKGET